MTDQIVEIDDELYSGIEVELISKDKEHVPYLTLEVKKRIFDGRFKGKEVGGSGFNATTETIVPDSGVEYVLRGLEKPGASLSNVTKIGQAVTILSDDVEEIDGETFTVVDVEEKMESHRTEVNGERRDAYSFELILEPTNE